RENALQCDAEAQRQERLHVQMCLASAGVTDCRRLQRRQICVLSVVAIVEGAEKVRRVEWRRTVRIRGVRHVNVCRDLGDGERVGLLSSSLSEGVTRADMDRYPSSKIGQPEVHTTVATECGSKQREKSLVLIDRQQLPVA